MPITNHFGINRSSVIFQSNIYGLVSDYGHHRITNQGIELVSLYIPLREKTQVIAQHNSFH